MEVSVMSCCQEGYKPSPLLFTVFAARLQLMGPFPCKILLKENGNVCVSFHCWERSNREVILKGWKVFQFCSITASFVMFRTSVQSVLCIYTRPTVYLLQLPTILLPFLFIVPFCFCVLSSVSFSFLPLAFSSPSSPLAYGSHMRESGLSFQF